MKKVIGLILLLMIQFNIVSCGLFKGNGGWCDDSPILNNNGVWAGTYYDITMGVDSHKIPFDSTYDILTIQDTNVYLHTFKSPIGWHAHWAYMLSDSEVYNNRYLMIFHMKKRFNRISYDIGSDSTGAEEIYIYNDKCHQGLLIGNRESFATQSFTFGAELIMFNRIDSLRFPGWWPVNIKDTLKYFNSYDGIQVR